ncbi:hypothetical protein [Telluria aromaticivorans]|uniref:Uncharacterized protein n=1 Tax=Telluria aromaticivorans TaxID=2725995 RepID=A0A7Y2NZD6_9BURK|nr:hypothetical protein [Telluria aromaticivorans]NNG22959.1 hypothetical protein [Telluria aromaticivorans]
MRVPDGDDGGNDDDENEGESMDGNAAIWWHIKAKPGVLLAPETVLDAPVGNTFIIPTVYYQNLSYGPHLLNFLTASVDEILFHILPIREIFFHRQEMLVRRDAC